jgi:plastocyanin
MAMKSLGFAGIVIAVLTVACGGDMPLAPGQLNNDPAATTEAPMSSASSAPAPKLTSQSTSEVVVTLQPDRTASPAVVSVAVGQTILMVNNSSQYARVRSYNCSEFSIVGLQPGDSRHTWPFEQAGRTCEYFVSAYPNKIFQGKVNVY